MKYSVILFLGMLILINCKSERIISVDVSNFKEFSVDGDRVEISLIKSFVNYHPCDSSKKLFQASAFLCKINNANDTVLVFSLCTASFGFLKANYKEPRWLVLENIHVQKKHPNILLSNVDEALLTKDYQYVVADIYNLMD